METFIKFIEEVKKVLETLKEKEFGPEFIIVLGMGTLGAYLDIYEIVDVNAGFIVVLTGLVDRLVKAIRGRNNGNS